MSITLVRLLALVARSTQRRQRRRCKANGASHAQQIIVATVQADRRQVAATATAEAQSWSELAEATTSHSTAAAATADAQPTAAPDRVVSRAAGRIVDISAQEQGGELVVTLEIVP